MNPRSEARRIALETLYEAEIRDETPTGAWHRRSGESDQALLDADLDDRGRDEAVAYAAELVRLVESNEPRIDELISTYADRWSLQRMPVVDRCIARMATAELLAGSVPVAVVANEAVELAKALSTDDSPRYLNGLIGRLAEVVAEAD